MSFLHYQTVTIWLHANPHWASFAAFIVAFAESVAILGTIIPGSITMTAIGILVGSGVIPMGPTLISAMFGAVLGDSLSYFTGYYFKNGIRNVWPFKRHPEWLNHAQDFFNRHGGKSIFFGRFIGPIRAMIPIIAGMLAMRPLRFFPVDIIAAIIWAPLYLLPGYLIGLAAMELPSDIAARLIVTLLLVLVGIWIVIWLIRKTSTYVTNQIDRLLNFTWQKMLNSKRWHWVCRLLQDANHPDDHGQLLLFMTALLAMLLFTALLCSVISYHIFQNIDIWFYHFFRGFRTDKIDHVMVILSFFAARVALYASALIIFISLWVQRLRWAAWHWIIVCVSTGLLGLFFQATHNVPRPPGIQLVIAHSSFPSIQIAIACAFYGFLAWLICLKQSKLKKAVYTITAVILILSMLTRIYLCVHWFSDVLGSFLLGTFCATVGAISYQRRLSPAPNAKTLIMVACISLLFTVGIEAKVNAKKVFISTSPVWDKTLVPMSTWWSKSNEVIPVYRTTNFGYPVELLNIQWAGDIKAIRQELLQSGWKTEPGGLTKLITQLQEQQRISHFDILPTLYADQRPALTMTKKFANNNETIMLRLWPANIVLLPQNTMLWVGTFNYTHPYGKTILRHIYHLLPQNNAIQDLQASLTLNQWEFLIRSATNIPQALMPVPYTPHYTILIRPIEASSSTTP